MLRAERKLFRTIDTYYPQLNFVGHEPLDSLILGVLSLLNSPPTDSLYIVAQVLIITAGSLLLATKLLPRNWSQQLLFAVACSCGFVALTSGDIIWLRWHWFPTLVASVVFLRLSPTAINLLFLIAAHLFWTLSAGSLAFIGIGLAQLLAAAISKLNDGRESNQQVNHALFLPPRLNSAISIVFAIFAIVLTPHYPMPDYPSIARLTFFSPFQLYPAPLLGKALLPNPIVFTAYILRLAFYLGIFVLLAFSLLLPLFRKRQNGSCCLVNRMATLTVISVVIVGAELVLPLHLSAYAAFPFLTRVIPGLCLSGLPWLLLPIAYFALLTLTIQLCSQPIYLASTIISLLALICSRLDYPALELPDHLGQVANVSVEQPIKLARSPSQHLIELVGPWAAISRDFSTMTRLVHGVDFSYSIHSNAAPNSALALDLDANTRWSTGRPQLPGDFIELEFEQEVSLDRIILSTRGTAHDYPRGIRIDGGDSAENLKLIVEYPNWPGPVYWTPKGFPYFGPQSEVVLDFPRQQQLKFLRATQLASGAKFNWSISEIKLYRKKSEN